MTNEVSPIKRRPRVAKKVESVPAGTLLSQKQVDRLAHGTNVEVSWPYKKEFVQTQIVRESDRVYIMDPTKCQLSRVGQESWHTRVRVVKK